MKYIVSQYNHLDIELMKEWKKAWDNSPSGHIFNSPYWFQACLGADSYHEVLILVCRDEDQKFMGILPLIKGKKFGFNVYLSPGRKYLDKSTLLITTQDLKVFQIIVNELNLLGSYYLTELSEEIAKYAKGNMREVGISQCSDGRDLMLGGDALRYLSKENRRRLLKRIREDSSLIYVNDRTNIERCIQLARSIEVESSKANDHKDIFSDPYLLTVCTTIQKIKPGLLSFDFLYQGEVPICYKYGFITHEIYHYSNTAYRWSHQKLSPGRLLMIQIFQKLQSIGVKHVDFSRGDTSFKREFSDSLYRQFTLYHIRNPLFMLIWRLMYRVKVVIKL